MDQSVYDICIVGGAGHVGAPLALVLADRGFRILVYDLNQSALDGLAAGRMHFMEEGGQELLRAILPTGKLGFSSDPAMLKGIPNVILTIGTPIDEFSNPITGLLTKCIDTLLPYLDTGVCLILRSTVAPGSTDFLDRYLKGHGKSVHLAFCPERVVQGKAIEEIQTLAQIISGLSPQAIEKAKNIFQKVAPELVEMTPQEAEYAKLICNAYRYIQFAATNQLYMMVESAGLDYNRMLSKVKQGYPRMGHIPRAGFSAGPCLMKDTMQLFAFKKHNFILGEVAMTINEGLPDYIVSQLMKNTKIAGRKVGILGMAFKPESDDIRNSLSYKLKKILCFQGADLFCSDEYVKDKTFISKEELLSISEVVIIGVPHNSYRKLKPSSSQIIIDIWGTFTQC
jgi:UDP-N-acetyl-D-mannosaminuronic acid dehydrogenase